MTDDRQAGQLGYGRASQGSCCMADIRVGMNDG
jgi:hypothetical protein